MAALMARAGLRLTPEAVKSEATLRIETQERRIAQVSRMDAARAAYADMGERFVERRRVPR